MRGEFMHGGNIRKAQEIYGRDDFIDLSANINPFGPPPGVWQALEQGAKEIVNYPDPQSLALRTVLSNQFEIPLPQIMVGNGAGELIFTIINALKPRKVAIPVPSFSEYERAARSVEAEITFLPFGAKGWTDSSLISEEWADYLSGCDLLFLCSPHNPTGSVISQDLFVQLLEVTARIGCRIVFDESFVDFLPEQTRWSARSYLTKHEHLIVLYSLTKFYSLPGLRLGAAFASSALLNLFEKFRDPWSVNVLAQVAGAAALQDPTYAGVVREKLEGSRSFFYREFAALGLDSLQLLPGCVNFSLIEVRGSRMSELINHLGQRGILVRDCRNFNGLDGQFIRVAIKDIPAMQALLDGLKSFFA